MTGTQGHTPGAGTEYMADPDEIIARDIRFDIIENRKARWYGGDVVKTALVDGLSIFLPDGERFFIRSLKHYTPLLKDRRLAAEINGYAVQEAFHTREHENYNRAMTMLGQNVAEMERPVKFALDSVKNPLHRLAVTCAIEHFTATLSTVTLRDPALFDDAEPAYRRLWMWHALEELEHKAVALDVLNAATANMSGLQRYLLRTVAMHGTLFSFLMIFLRNTRVYAKADGSKTGLRFWGRFAWVTFGKPGFWRRCAPLILKYYLPGFDPRNKDDALLMQRGREWLAKETGAYPAAPAH